MVKLKKMCATAATVLAAASAVRGAEVTVKNDSFVNGGSTVVQAGFVAGERAAAWLTSPCDGTIVAVQVAWRSLSGGTPQSLEESITIFSAGTFPTPGAVKINSSNNQPAVLEGPVMTDGVFNEFRFMDDQNSVPLSVPVTAGEVFVVSFQFANSPNPGNGPSVLTDVGSGCQAGKNGLFAIPPGIWFNSCSLGLSGDFLIRAVVLCPDSGACCLAGVCVPSMTQQNCEAQKGVFLGNNSTCGAGACVGACCLTNGTCQSLTENACLTQGGTFRGIGVPCDANACKGACCVPATQNCIFVTQSLCQTGNGIFQGLGVQCADIVCFPMGACCLADGSCVGPVSPSACVGQGGVFQGHQTTCGTVNCPVPEGACCLGTTCFGPLSESDCEVGFGGVWQGPLTTCGAGSCQPSCPADIAPPGGNGLVNIDDLTQIILNWGTNNAVADIDNDGLVEIDDLTAVILGWGTC